MNVHIELVKKWLADKDSVTPGELKVNSDSASAATYAVVNGAAYGASAAASSAYDAAAAAAAAAIAAAAAATYADADAAAATTAAAALVKQFERLTKLSEADGKEIGSYKNKTGLRGENAQLGKTIEKLRAEIEELKEQLSMYEAEHYDRQICGD